MAGSMSIASGGTTKTLSYLAGVQPDHNVDNGVVQNVGLFGKLFTYSNYRVINHRFEFNNISKADADVINGWALAKTTLTYTPDTDTAGTTYQVKIINDGKPFGWMPNTPADTLFQGSLMIRGVEDQNAV